LRVNTQYSHVARIVYILCSLHIAYICVYNFYPVELLINDYMISMTTASKIGIKHMFLIER